MLDLRKNASLVFSILTIAGVAVGEEPQGLLSPGGLFQEAGSSGVFRFEMPALEAGPAALAGGSSTIPYGLVPLGAGDEDDDETPMYVALRAGPLWYMNDVSEYDVGLDTEAAFGFRPIRLLAVEIMSGYFWGEDADGSTKGELLGVPLVANAMVTLPILLFKIDAGIGVGGYYVHNKVDLGATCDTEDDFVFGGNIFLGTRINLGPVFVGIKGKYTYTTEADLPDGKSNLEGFSILAQVGFMF